MLARLMKGIGANALGQLVLVVLQLVQVPILASHWGLARYGLWLMLSTIPNYLSFSDFGFGKAAANDMIMKVALDDRQGALGTYQSATVLVYVITAAMLVALQSIVWLLPNSLFGAAAPAAESRIALSLLVCYGIASLAGGATSSGPLQSTGHYATEATAGAIMWASEGMAVCTVVASGGSMIQVAATLLIIRVTAMITFTGIARHYAPLFRVGLTHATAAEIRRLLGPASAMMTLPLANALVLQGTAMAVGIAASPAAVPAFTATRTLSRVPMQVTGIFVRASMPEFSSATARGDRVAQARLLALALMTSLLMLLPISLTLVVAGPRIVALWTHGVVHAPHALMVVMSAVLLANGLWVPLSNLVISVNRHGLFTYRFVCLAAVAVAITYVLSWRLGSLGGGIGMLVVDVSMLVLLVKITNDLFGPYREVLRELPNALRVGFEINR